VSPYQVLNTIAGRIDPALPVFLMTPYISVIGNCSEEIYYALLKARREGRRAALLFPRPLFWKFRLAVGNRGLMHVESPHGRVERGRWAAVAGWALTLAFFVSGRSYLRAKAMLRLTPVPRWRRFANQRNNIFHVIPSIGRRALWQPDGVERFDWSVAMSLGWGRQFEHPLAVDLSEAAARIGDEGRAALGIPSDAWFVTLHVREGGFYGDVDSGRSRNADISNYLSAIRAITDAGGYVVRLGDASMKPLPAMPRVIDYARSPMKSELLDIYLVARCRFFIGMNSGPMDVALLFHRPMLLTNLSEWSLSFPRKQGDRAILKHVFSKRRNRCLSLGELVAEPYGTQAQRGLGEDYDMLENSPEEIRALVEEYLEDPEGELRAPEQDAFNRARLERIRQWLEDPAVRILDDPREDVTERYRMAAHADQAGGALGRHFASDYWHAARVAEAI
jgi:putative glycosyltransferase (TIGR04372 family)